MQTPLAIQILRIKVEICSLWEMTRICGASAGSTKGRVRSMVSVSLSLLVANLSCAPLVKVNVRASDDLDSNVTQYFATVPLYSDEKNGSLAVTLTDVLPQVINQFETPHKGH
jgi:hypothetical protein